MVGSGLVKKGVGPFLCAFGRPLIQIDMMSGCFVFLTCLWKRGSQNWSSGVTLTLHKTVCQFLVEVTKFSLTRVTPKRSSNSHNEPWSALVASCASSLANTCRLRTSLPACASRSLKESICLANSPSRTLVTADRILASRVVKPWVSLRSSTLVYSSQTLLNQPKAWSGFVEAATETSGM